MDRTPAPTTTTTETETRSTTMSDTTPAPTAEQILEAYVASGRNAAETARQVGLSARTVMRRIRPLLEAQLAAAPAEDVADDAPAEPVAEPVADEPAAPAAEDGPVVKLTGRSSHQVAATDVLGDLVVETGKTTVVLRGTPVEVFAALSAATAKVEDKGVRTALHSLRRAVEKVAERDAAKREASEARPARKPRERTSGSSRTDGPPPRCPGGAGGKNGLDGPGSTRCPVCTQDAAPVRKDGSLGSHKLLRPRQG